MAFDLKGALSTIAPTLAAMLGGPLAGTAVAGLMGAFGLQSSGDQQKDITTISGVMQSGSMTPEIIAAVRAADQHHAEVIAQQGIDLKKLNDDHQEAMAKLATDDVISARKRQAAVKDNTPAVLAYFLIGGFLGVSVLQLVALMFFPVQAAAIPQSGWLLIGQISGYLANEAKQAGGFYFGNNTANEKATALLAQAPAIPK